MFGAGASVLTRLLPRNFLGPRQGRAWSQGSVRTRQRSSGLRSRPPHADSHTVLISGHSQKRRGELHSRPLTFRGKFRFTGSGANSRALITDHMPAHVCPFLSYLSGDPWERGFVTGRRVLEHATSHPNLGKHPALSVLPSAPDWWPHRHYAALEGSTVAAGSGPPLVTELRPYTSPRS